jgi:ATP-binding cassette, subfamily C (CFTR/MRP), member 1
MNIYRIKQITALIVAVVLIVSSARLYGLSQPPHIKGPYLASLLLSALAAVCLSLLLYLEQRISSTISSDLSTVYLIGSIVCDTIILTVPRGESTIWEASLLSLLTRCIAHTLLLLLECLSGGPSAEGVRNSLSTEEVNGILSRVFFLWINPILARGYGHILTRDRLPYLSQDLKPRHIRRAILEAWRQRGSLLHLLDRLVVTGG